MQQTPFAPVEPDAADSCGIAVMAKASAPGHAKTRLVPPLTPAQAADCNTAFLQAGLEVRIRLPPAGSHVRTCVLSGECSDGLNDLPIGRRDLRCLFETFGRQDGRIRSASTSVIGPRCSPRTIA